MNTEEQHPVAPKSVTRRDFLTLAALGVGGAGGLYLVVQVAESFGRIQKIANFIQGSCQEGVTSGLIISHDGADFLNSALGQNTPLANQGVRVSASPEIDDRTKSPTGWTHVIYQCPTPQ